MKIIFIDHYDSFASLIAYHFRKAGANVTMYKSDASIETIEAASADMILLGPGPNGPAEAGNFLSIIGHFHKRTPIFGICLGFQALMHYFGAKVEVLSETIHGASSSIQHDGKTIFSGLPNPAQFSRYHSLGTYAVPAHFQCSARALRIIMAARHEHLPIEGIQFHPESILSMKNYAGEKLIGNVVRHYERYTSKNNTA